MHIRSDSYVYCYVNLVNGKRYYGKGRRKRILDHQVLGTSLLSNAIRKHGIGNFNVYKLFEGLTDKEALQLEIDCISRYRTNFHREYEPGVFGHGYNQTDGGEGGGVVGRPLSKEHRAKLSASKLGRSFPKVAESLRGRPLSPEHRASLRRAKSTPESKARMSAAQKASLQRPEVRLKLSFACKGKKHTPEARARISAMASRQHARRRFKVQLDVMLQALDPMKW